MTGPNHIAGGIVFTGIFASLWNINVFASFDLLLWTAFTSLLPDIDHTKSPVGKMFYPLARFLDRRFGHRTITHSLLFLALCTLGSAFTENLFSEQYIYTTIVFFGIFSHLLLDMITVQGVMFFYPFAKNPCVIPANPNLRIRTGNKRAEVAVFCISLLLLFSCLDLFKNGFWTEFNRSLGTLKHLHAENKRTDKLLLVEYSYKKNNKDQKGEAYLLESKENEAVLFNSSVFDLSDKCNLTKIDFVKPLQTKFAKQTKEINFFNIKLDSLQATLRNKIVTGNIQSSVPVIQIISNIKHKSDLIKLEYAFNPLFVIEIDSSNHKTQTKLDQALIKLEKNKNKYLAGVERIDKMIDSLKTLETKLEASNDFYDINKHQKEIIALKKRIARAEEKRGIYKPDPLLVYQIEKLREELHQTNDVLFSGVLTEIVIPKNIQAVAHKN